MSQVRPSSDFGAAMLHSVGVSIAHPGTGRAAVRELHATVRQGEILVVAGPNGSGKSTWLAALGRELRPRAGTIRDHAGVRIENVPRRAFARQVARLPQDPRCAPGLEVHDLVASGRHPHRGWLRPLDALDRAAINEALAWTDVAHLRGRAVETLSGGERRRVWLAMVLAQGAPIVLLDEPMAGLDLGHSYEIEALLKRLARKRGVTLVVVIHDLAAAVRIADRVAILHAGRLYACGTPEEILTRDTLADVFGLEAQIERRPDGKPTLHIAGPATLRRFL